MQNIKLIALIFLSMTVISEDGRLDRDPNDYKYTSLGIYAFDAKDDSGIEAKFSLSLPGPLYLVAEAKADGVNVDNETYDKFTKALRIGAHVGIGDVLNSISVGGVSLKLENFLDKPIPKYPFPQPTSATTPSILKTSFSLSKI